MAARSAAARAKPLLTPEYLPDLDGFARRWFRSLFHRLPLESAVVSDNHHEIPAESALHRVFAVAAGEAPPSS